MWPGLQAGTVLLTMAQWWRGLAGRFRVQSEHIQAGQVQSVGSALLCPPTAPGRGGFLQVEGVKEKGKEFTLY